MERIVGFIPWKKKPGVTVFTICDGGNSAVVGQEVKTRFFDGGGSQNYQKINEGCIGASVQWQFTEGFNNSLKIVDCKFSK